ncbi:hypothetical protein [Clostridium sp. FP1]|nr:hypothetical protein [Clostridium sp. FP1]MBZ9634082.1 hypothetical protein [Clostridium sp. FP1]
MEYNNVLFVDDEVNVLSSIKRAVITEVGTGTIFTIKLPLTKINDVIEEN